MLYLLIVLLLFSLFVAFGVRRAWGYGLPAALLLLLILWLIIVG